MKIIREKTIASSKWLSFKEIDFINEKSNDQQHSWQFIERKGNPKIATIIVQSLKTKKFLFIEQFRIPIKKTIIEFPAGLVDKGESIEDGALRELREETGYTAQIKFISPALPRSAGLTNEASTFVFCTIEDEKLKGKTNFDESEEIKHSWMTSKEFFKYIEYNKELLISIDVYSFFMRELFSIS